MSAKTIRQWLLGKRVLRAATIGGKFRRSVYERICDETWAKWQGAR